MDIVDRFINYTKFETTSDGFSGKRPSSDKEYALLDELEKELKELNVKTIKKNGFVYGFIDSNNGSDNTLLLMSHVDTAPDASGKNPEATKVLYNGGIIKLKNGKELNPKEFSSLNKHVGHELIVTNGNCLLGADDKAGVSIIMDFIERAQNNEFKHPNIISIFNSDEEIGEGTRDIDIEMLKNRKGSIFAYTVDGGEIDEFSYETFNAAAAKVEIEGLSVHPGSAKGQMINASEVLIDFHNNLPKARPETTEKREGFIHMTGSRSETQQALAYYILRSFDRDELESYKKAFRENEERINNKYNKKVVRVDIEDSYYNMYEVLKDRQEIIDLAHKALKENGIEYFDSPIRGGTDGSALSFMGIPCPNLGTGGENFHGVYEYLDTFEMKKMVDVIKTIAVNIK